MHTRTGGLSAARGAVDTTPACHLSFAICWRTAHQFTLTDDSSWANARVWLLPSLRTLRFAIRQLMQDSLKPQPNSGPHDSVVVLPEHRTYSAAVFLEFFP
jgi:hypothetical protein